MRAVLSGLAFRRNETYPAVGHADQSLIRLGAEALSRQLDHAVADVASDAAAA